MNAGILVLVLDLPSAVAYVDIHAHEHRAFLSDHWIAEPAQCDSEVSGRRRAGVEMLVIHTVGWRKDDAVIPVHTNEVRIVFVPQ